MTKSALVVGGTGLVGNLLIDRLLEDADFSRVTSLVRRATGRSHPKLVERVVDFDETLAPVEADVVFCTLGTTIRKAGSQEAFAKVDLELPLKIARTQKGRSETFAIVTATGADVDSRFFYNRVKGQVERELTKLHFPKLVILRPSLIMGDRDERRPAEKISMLTFRVLGPLMRGPLARLRGVPGEKIAARLIECAKSDVRGVNTIESEKI